MRSKFSRASPVLVLSFFAEGFQKGLIVTFSFFNFSVTFHKLPKAPATSAEVGFVDCGNLVDSV